MSPRNRSTSGIQHARTNFIHRAPERSRAKRCRPIECRLHGSDPDLSLALEGITIASRFQTRQFSDAIHKTSFPQWRSRPTPGSRLISVLASMEPF